jgi:hypothetical protein
MSDTTQGTVKSADRVLDRFELLAHAGREMAHNEIADVLQIPKSSLTQLLRNLIARGYVEMTPNGRGHRLGATLLSLSQSAGQVRDLAALADAFLTEIRRETRESSALNQRKRDQAEVVATILGPAPRSRICVWVISHRATPHPAVRRCWHTYLPHCRTSTSPAFGSKPRRRGRCGRSRLCASNSTVSARPASPTRTKSGCGSGAMDDLQEKSDLLSEGEAVQDERLIRELL